MTKHNIALVLTTDQRHPYFHIKAHPVLLTDDTGDVRGANDVTGYDLRDFTVTAQADCDSRERTNLYGWAARFEDVYAVDARKAESMLRTLKMVDRKLEKFDAEWGRPDKFSTFVIRAAKAIGARRLIVRRSGSALYGTADYRHMDFSEGADLIDYWERQWKQGERATA